MDQTASSEAPRRPFSRRQLLATALATPVALAAGQRWAMAQSPAITVYRGPMDPALVALTFDAGADRGYCASILDTLAGSGVRASFGVTGQWAESNGDLVQRVVAEGHQLFNHTYTHRSFTGLTPGGPGLRSAERISELETTEQVFINLTGVGGRPYFRPPFGDFNASVLTDLGRVGFTHNLMWSLDVNGWRGISQDQIVSRVLTNQRQRVHLPAARRRSVAGRPRPAAHHLGIAFPRLWLCHGIGTARRNRAAATLGH